METLLQRLGNLETYVASIRKDAQLQFCSLILFMFPLRMTKLMIMRADFQQV